MLKVDHIVPPSPEQWEFVMEGMRNPMNSWDKNDSEISYVADENTLEMAPFEFFMGENDMDLASRLAAGGSVHGKYRRQLPLMMNITAPLYWWKEFDTYKIGTVANSCSTMHKIHAKEFSLEDFSVENLNWDSLSAMEKVVDALNMYREKFISSHDKNDWKQLIQLLPSSYNQMRSVSMNYENVYQIVKQRTRHKLDEWKTLIEALQGVPYYDVVVESTLKAEGFYSGKFPWGEVEEKHVTHSELFDYKPTGESYSTDVLGGGKK